MNSLFKIYNRNSRFIYVSAQDSHKALDVAVKDSFIKSIKNGDINEFHEEGMSFYDYFKSCGYQMKNVERVTGVAFLDYNQDWQVRTIPKSILNYYWAEKQLKHCPFCGDFRIELLPQKDNWLLVKCRVCPASMKVLGSQRSAIASWNNRTPERKKSNENKI